MADEERMDRARMMEEMLRDHYEEKSEKERKRKRENAKKYMDSLENPPEKDEFHFPSLAGSVCSLQGSYYQQEPYYVTEVFHPKSHRKEFQRALVTFSCRMPL